MQDLTILIAIKERSHFRAKSSKREIQKTRFIFEVELAKGEEDEEFEKTRNYTTSISIFIVLINLFANFVLSQSIEAFWGMVNTLQLLTHFSLLNFKIPRNFKGFN